jgi:hypothetical protein
VSNASNEIGTKISYKVYNESLKKLLYYHWVQQFVIPHFRAKSLKMTNLFQGHHILRFPPIVCTSTTNINLMSKNYK